MCWKAHDVPSVYLIVAKKQKIIFWGGEKGSIKFWNEEEARNKRREDDIDDDDDDDQQVWTISERETFDENVIDGMGTDADNNTFFFHCGERVRGGEHRYLW